MGLSTVVSAKPGRSRRETQEATRRELLEAGVELLGEHPVGSVVDQVKAAEVASRAGRTIGAFYHHWDTQESYRRELIGYVLDPARLPSAPQADVLRQALGAGTPLEEIVRRHAVENFEHLRASPFLRLQMALWPKQESDETVSALLNDLYQASSDTYIPLYQALLDANGLVPRPPFTIDTIATLFTALAEGLVLRHAVQPHAVPDDMPTVQSAAREELDGQLDEGSWNLLSVAVLALLPSVTVPSMRRDPDIWLDHEDLRGLVRRLRETFEAMAGQRSERLAPAATDQPRPTSASSS